MEVVKRHDKYGYIKYEETITGKKLITINRQVLHSEEKNQFWYQNEGIKYPVIVNGSNIFGVNIELEGEVIPLVRTAKWHEIGLAFFVFFFISILGRNDYVNSAVPIVSILVSGISSMIFSYITLFSLKSILKIKHKIMSTFGFIILSILLTEFVSLIVWLIIILISTLGF